MSARSARPRCFCSLHLKDTSRWFVAESFRSFPSHRTTACYIPPRSYALTCITASRGCSRLGRLPRSPPIGAPCATCGPQPALPVCRHRRWCRRHRFVIDVWCALRRLRRTRRRTMTLKKTHMTRRIRYQMRLVLSSHQPHPPQRARTRSCSPSHVRAEAKTMA